MLWRKSECICWGPIIFKRISVRNLQKHRQPAMSARWRRRWETSDDMQQATTVWHLMLDLTVAGVARLPQDSKVLYRFWSSNLRRRWEIVVTFVCEAFKILHMIFLISDLIRSCMISTNEIIDQTQPQKKLTCRMHIFLNISAEPETKNCRHW